MEKQRYGFDTPALLGFFIIYMIAFPIVGWFLPGWIGNTDPQFALYLLYYGAFTGVVGLFFVLYMLYGHFKGRYTNRSRLVNLMALTGNEKVLNFATRPAFMNDVIQAQEVLTRSPLLSPGSHTQEILDIEEDSLDAVVSTFTMHKVVEKKDRTRTLQELGRVLKSGGRLVLCDFAHIKEFYETLHEMGWSQVVISKNQRNVFPPVRYLVATKPEKSL
ncbi:MAG: hypothetical protein S4CHLAM102_05520 [Chlamydiia bacterium]|nr:hypothetical protein [Chlamydiia bacterium]